MSHITIFISNEEVLEFASGRNDVCIEGQDGTSTYFFTCSFGALTSYLGRSLLYFSLQHPEAPAGKLWRKVRMMHDTPIEDDARHTILRNFLLECCADLFLIGFYVVGSYEYGGKTWEVQPMDKTDVITLPDNFYNS